ncbi:helix-turn-helix domain-containing protein [Nonomuraea ceibae]|uniref:helix-turn-helix domain-containing protein n=1 Tax=Nonomuraea ceibae TaxID=1935170 RepID=UPI001C5F47F7|nr:AraC family transcriptional regulator [Nonomuraea ceibae]
MTPRWQGWAALRPGVLCYGGRIGATGPHAHRAAQFLTGEGLVLRGADGRDHAVRAALIPANAPHTIVRGTADGLLALVDPARIGQPGGGEAAPGSAAAWRLGPDVPVTGDLDTLTALVDALTGHVPPRPPHPALAGAERAVRRMLPGRVRLSDVARAVHLSESRLSHLFTAEFGLPFRPYVLWARLDGVWSALAAGATLTEAAHAAGFADAAHLSRVVRRMMGNAPSTMTAGVRWLS